MLMHTLAAACVSMLVVRPGAHQHQVVCQRADSSRMPITLRAWQQSGKQEAMLHSSPGSLRGTVIKRDCSTCMSVPAARF